MENYRPIVLISYLSKITEKVISNRIYDFIESRKVFSECQYGYCTNLSTEVTCINFVQKVFDYLDGDEKVAAALFFDLTAAFDIINREFLKCKLFNMGIGGKVLDWILSYLSSRKIIVSLNGEMSDESEMNIGVGQGSNIGPSLLILFINGLPTYLPTKDVFMIIRL